MSQALNALLLRIVREANLCQPDDSPSAARALPLRQFSADGVTRGRNREISPSDALRLCQRGVRGYLVTFDRCFELSAVSMQSILEVSHEVPEADEVLIHVYGRRGAKGSDTRIIVISVATFLQW